MTNSFFFNPLFPMWLVLLLSVPLFSFLIWKEFKRTLKFRWLRVLAQLVVLISILGILFKPGYFQKKDSIGIILLTDHYSKIQADSLLSIFPDLRIVRLPETESYRGSEKVESYHDLTDVANEIRFVLGEGLPSFALESMPQKNFQFLPALQPSGIIQLYIPEKIQENQRATIQGALNINEAITIRLMGPGGPEDSVTVKGKGRQSFSLDFSPKQPGLFVYSVQYKDGSGTKTEQLPIEVSPEKKLSILFLQKFPGFEVRQLKNFLAEKGHSLALRYQVSKNKDRTEFANLSPIRMSPLASSVLNTFDLVLVDYESLEALSPAEKNVLEESIHNGLGMILINSTPAEKDKLRQRFVPIEMKKSLFDTTQLNIASKKYTLPILPLQISESQSIYPITKNKKNILSAYTYNGFGKTGVQLLQETYRIALEGNIDEYAAIWSPLLEKIARAENEKYKIDLTNAFPVYQNEPLYVEIISSVKEHPKLMDESTALPLTEHVLIDNVWLGTSWAGKSGWHKLSADSAALHYFVSENSSWKSLRITNQIQKNKTAAGDESGVSQPETIQQRKIISPLFFYLLFLLASGFLWLAPKI